MKIILDINSSDLVDFIYELKTRGNFSIDIPDIKAVIKEAKFEAILNKNVWEVFSKRASIGLNKGGIHTIKDITKLEKLEDLIHYNGIGRKSYTEIKEFMLDNDLYCGMKI